MLTIVGVYENGQVRLWRHPNGISKARVKVAFLPESAHGDPEMRRAAGQRLLGDMGRGLDFGGRRFDRDEIYEDRGDEL